MNKGDKIRVDGIVGMVPSALLGELVSGNDTFEVLDVFENGDIELRCGRVNVVLNPNALIWTEAR